MRLFIFLSNPNPMHYDIYINPDGTMTDVREDAIEYKAEKK